MRESEIFLITGITGKVGGAAARNLLKMNKRVRALVRDEIKAAEWSSRGVELITGKWEDSSAMEKALNGVTGAYLMMPPSQTPSPDFREAKAVVASYKESLTKSPPSKVVALSSMGSENNSGLGLITATHLLEEALRDIPVPLALIRAGSFYANYLFGLQAAQTGTLPIFYAPTSRKVPIVATEDIGSEFGVDHVRS